MFTICAIKVFVFNGLNDEGPGYLAVFCYDLCALFTACNDTVSGSFLRQTNV